MVDVSQPYAAGVARKPATSKIARKGLLLRQIEQCAREAKTVRCHVTSDGLHLIPTVPGGLPISVFVCEGRQTVYFGGWYDEIDDAGDVVELVEKAMLGELRLVMSGDGQAYHTFVVEVRGDDGSWLEVGRMEAAFWLRQKPVRVIKCLCNEESGRRSTIANSTVPLVP